MGVAALLALVLPLQTPPVVQQWGSLDALLKAQYDGPTPVGNLMQSDAIGLGTFNGLDGEMVVLDGNVYQIDGFGDIHRPGRGAHSPFAFVTSPFRPSVEFAVPGPISIKTLGTLIDRKMGSYQGILAVQVDAQLANVRGRSFAAQLPPYRPFLQISDRQTIFTFPRLGATLVGYRMPDSVKSGNQNVPGYHFHFLNQARTTGGHLLEAKVLSGTVRVMRVTGGLRRQVSR